MPVENTNYNEETDKGRQEVSSGSKHYCSTIELDAQQATMKL